MMTPRAYRVTLTHEELERAKAEARRRIRQNVKQSARPAHGGPDRGDGDLLHLQGCKGELATSIFTGLPWFDGDKAVRGQIDVGGQIDVRTRKTWTGSLLVHPGDRERLPFVAAYTSLTDPEKRSVYLFGWTYAEEAKREEYWRVPTGSGRPVYMVPSPALRDMRGLFHELDIPEPEDRRWV